MNKSDIVDFASRTVLMVLVITVAIIIWARAGKKKIGGEDGEGGGDRR
jgi:hypothetical protein